MCSPTDSKETPGEKLKNGAENSVQKDDPTKDKQDAEKVPFSELLSFLDTRKSKLIFAVGIFFAILNGCVYPILAFIFSNSFSDLSSMSTPKVVRTALTFLGIGSYAFVASCGQNICFEHVSKAACYNFRLRWFSALLRQDAAFFDVNDISGFASSIEPNAQTVKRGLGKKFGEGIQFTVTSIGGIIFALTMSWRVALLVLSILPLVSGSALAVMKINQSQTESQSKAYAKAGSVAYQTVSSIRTVFALNAVPEMIKVYAEATQDAYNKAVRPLIKIGLVNGKYPMNDHSMH
jgi:ATP-binding cassette subfamily B (MDR/TAP) protein 1